MEDDDFDLAHDIKKLVDQLEVLEVASKPELCVKHGRRWTGQILFRVREQNPIRLHATLSCDVFHLYPTTGRFVGERAGEKGGGEKTRLRDSWQAEQRRWVQRGLKPSPTVATFSHTPALFVTTTPQ